MRVDIGRGPMIWPTIRVAMLTLAIAGCAQVPVPKASAPPIPARWRHAGTTPDRGLPRADLRSWWTAFADPQLNQLVDQALHGNPGLAASRARIQAAADLLGMHRQRFKPTVQAATHNAQPANSRHAYFQFGVDANWELGLFGRKKADIQVARGRMKVARSRAAAARVALVAQVASHYLQLQSAREQQRFSAALVAQDRRRCALLRTRIKSQLSGPADLAQAQGQLADDDTRVIHLHSRVDQLEQALAAALGKDEPDPGWFSAPGLPTLHQGVRQLPPADLLRLRPDVVRTQGEVKQAIGALGIAHANRFPRVALDAGLMWSTRVSRRNAGDTDFRMTPVLGPEISIPLFDWGRRLAAERARASQLRAALLHYRQTVLGAVAEVEDAFASLKASRRVLAERRHTLAAQARIVAAQQRLVGLGLTSPLDVLRAKREHLLARIQLSQAQLDHDQAFVNLYQAYGGPALSAAEGG